MKSNYCQKQMQLWCRLILSVMTFILPFVGREAGAVGENNQKITNLSNQPYNYHVSQDIAVWGGYDKVTGNFKNFVYDFATNQEVQLNSSSSDLGLSGNRIVYSDESSAIKNIYLCEYNSATQDCSITEIAHDQGFIYSLEMDGDNIVWTSQKNTQNGLSKVMYCSYNGAGGCSNANPVLGEIESGGGFYDLSGEYIVFYKTENQTDYGDIFLFHIGKKKLIQITNTPQIRDVYPRIDGNLIVWSNYGMDPTTAPNYVFKSEHSWIHYCYFDDTTETCPEQILDTGIAWSENPDVHGDTISFTGFIKEDGINNNIDVYLQNLTSQEKFRATSLTTQQREARIYNNRLIWADDTENPFQLWNLYYVDAHTLIPQNPPSPPPPTNQYAPILTAPMIAKLLWDQGGFVVKFDAYATDPDNIDVYFTHPTANEIPPTSTFNWVMSGDATVTGHFDWKPSLDIVTGKTGINWNDASINWSDAASINWGDTKVFVNFEASDGQFIDKELSGIRPKYEAYCGNQYCDNGLTAENKAKLTSAYGINWDDVVPYNILNTFTDRGENILNCQAECTSRCGDRVVISPETCDDGNLNSNDNCLNTCVASRCGDGVLKTSGTAPYEACDDGNVDQTDGCLNNCTAARCGDGIVRRMYEGCDDGNTIQTDGCLNNCAIARCGDGYVQSGFEQCDDGNTINTDGCTTQCKLPVCGDGYKQGTEACDDGNLVNTDGCTTQCKLPVCGDGYQQAGEACDDGNTINSDGCTDLCKLPACGDGFKNGTEACDGTDGTDAHHTCDTSCNLVYVPYCGDGIKNGTEACDGTDGVGPNQTCTPSCELVPYDVTKPNVEIKVPTDQPTYNTDADKLSLSALASDNVGITSFTWKNNANGATGAVVASYYGYLAVDVPLVVGNNEIVYTATDAAGNVGTDTITVKRVGLGSNLVDNGDFDPAFKGQNWNGWTTYVKLNSTDGKTAPNSAIINGTGVSTLRDLNHAIIDTVVGGNTYRFKYALKSTVTTGSYNVQIEWRKPGGGSLGKTVIRQINTASGWTLYSDDIVAPPLTGKIVITFVSTAGTVGDLSIDDVSLQQKLN